MTDHTIAKLRNDSRLDEARDRPDKARRELALTYGAITLTLVAAIGSAGGIAVSLSQAAAAGHWATGLRQIVFLAIVSFLIYGGLVYQFARAGYLKRAARHRAATSRELARFYHDAKAAAVSILVPSYKEDPQVVQRTLLSAALQDYPKRRVVLLIDDPPKPFDHEDMRALAATRALPDDVWEILQKPREHFGDALASFLDRSARGPLNRRDESRRLSGLYREAATWFEEQAARYASQGHAERLFVELTFREPARFCLEASSRWESRAHAGRPPAQELREAYQRLADRFTVEVTAFERKRFDNLSHEPNKAMNLNSYIALMGQRSRLGGPADAPRLESAGPADAELVIPDADYVLMVDADSVLSPDYTLRLAYILSQPGNERMAVAQTPYSAFPGAPGVLERIAGATTDIQYIIHQGFTSFAATFWVGANALVRKAALEDIAEWGQERGHAIRRFIQDRTVIEDTESSVDLIDRGWRLYNYPERLAFSATPPDFGSLLIQRRRWANGGLLILPKLVRYLLRNVRRPGVLGESFMRCHYLASLAVVNTGLLLILAVSFDDLLHNLWLPLTALPYCGLYARDLRRCGYRANDVLRVYALNLMLIPVHLAGVFQSLRQGWTGTKSPFGRTPKVQERTITPWRYLVAEYVILAHWLLGTVLEYFHGRPFLAAFALANAAFLAYALVAFIGLRESWQDLALAVTAAGSGSAPARPRPLSPDY
jgi:cellulose synthase/poly-beta-1,6-N-acetylglucosamine synthase-like glycosyltransferase